MHTKEAHNKLLQFCGDNAGVGVSIDVIKKIVEDQAYNINHIAHDLRSKVKFRNMEVFFVSKISSPNAGIKFQQNDKPYLILGNVSCEIDVKLNGKPTVVSKLDVEYNEIKGLLEVVDGKIIVSLHDFDTKSQSTLWENDETVKTEFNLNDDDWEDLKVHIEAIKFQAVPAVAEAFIESLELPNFLEIFVGINFETDPNNLKIEIVDELLMLSSTSSINFDGCPSYKPTGKSASVKDSITIKQNSNFISAEVDLNKHPDGQFPEHPKDVENLEEGHVFLFTPIKLLDVDFRKILRPAINFNERIRKGPFIVRYSATATLENISVTSISSWPVTFLIESGIGIFGQAGAGIKVGSIRFPIVDVALHGRGNVDVEFFMSYNHEKQDIVFVSKLKRAKINEIRLNIVSPALPWPLSEIAEWILERVVLKLIPPIANKVLSVTRIPIAELGLLADVGELVNGWTGHTDGLAATSGVKLNL